MRLGIKSFWEHLSTPHIVRIPAKISIYQIFSLHKQQGILSVISKTFQKSKPNHENGTLKVEIRSHGFRFCYSNIFSEVGSCS
jgi:hypothetical protein